MLLNLVIKIIRQIATLVNETALHNLGLTCHRYQPLSQEAFLYVAILVPDSSWKLVDALHGRPELIQRLSHLRLGWYVAQNFA